jgi:hypothetical protein
MLRLCINDKEYLLSNVDKKKILRCGKINGFYYGSSTRISPIGEIWNTDTKHQNIKLTIQIQFIETWSTIFETHLDFLEENLKYNIKIYNDYKDLENYISSQENRNPDYEDCENEKNRREREIIQGNLCLFQSYTRLKLKTEKYTVTISFRDLYKFRDSVEISSFSYKYNYEYIFAYYSKKLKKHFIKWFMQSQKKKIIKHFHPENLIKLLSINNTDVDETKNLDLVLNKWCCV